MEKQRFGQISLPKITNKLDYPYMVIIDTGTFLEDTDLKIYWLCYSNQPFYTGKFNHMVTGVETEGIAFNVSSSILLYQGLSEGVGWSQIEPSYDKTATWILVGTYENYVWTSHALTDKDTGSVKFEYYEPTLISNAAEQPQVSYLTQSPTYEIFDMANEIVCSANSVDNGELTYKWYERGLGLVSSYNFFTPTTYITKEENGELIATTGSKEYYCVVINSKNNTQTASIVSVVLTITAPTPELYNNFNFNLGWLLGNYSKRLSIADETKPLIDLDFKNYIKNTSSIPNKGSSGSKNNAKVVLNSGQAYYEKNGLILTKDANFSVPVNLTFDTSRLRIGDVFTWMIVLSDYIPSTSTYQRLCLGNNNLFSIFYNNNSKKFGAVLVDLPQNNFPKFWYNSKIVSYEQENGYVFELKAEDVITFTSDTETSYFYINKELAMTLPIAHIFFPNFPDTNNFLSNIAINKIGCGDVDKASEHFEQIKIKRFLYYDKVLNRNQITSIIDNIINKEEESTSGSQHPVAYLYNGVRLPILPEWDKTKYPNALISMVHDSETGEISYYGLHCAQDGYPHLGNHSSSSEKPYVTYANLFQGIKALYATTELKETEWGEFSETSIPATAQLSNVIWSSIDLYFSDGILALSASDPVPVYK